MFDDIPRIKTDHFLCKKCKNGNVILNIDDNWECDNCDFFHNPNIKLKGVDNESIESKML